MQTRMFRGIRDRLQANEFIHDIKIDLAEVGHFCFNIDKRE